MMTIVAEEKGRKELEKREKTYSRERRKSKETMNTIE